MKRTIVSLSVAVAMIAGVQPTRVRAGEPPVDAKAVGIATAQELDRLQNLRRIKDEIASTEVELARAEAIVKDWAEFDASNTKTPRPELKHLDADLRAQLVASEKAVEKETRKINIARVKDARDRLENLKAQQAALVAAK